MEKLSEKIMMSPIKEETKLNSSIHKEIRKASFISVEPEQSKRFKYLANYSWIKKSCEKLASIKRGANSIVQRIGLWSNKVDWGKITEEVSFWIINVSIEGLTANFATHYLFGLSFNVPMILAHGIVIEQGLSIFWRLKQNGPISTIPQKDK
jgi:hypothetical protein